jgi:hypothetical protein
MAIIGVTREQIEACRENYGEAHDAQLEVGGECSWCGAYEADETKPLGWVDEITGNVYAADGSMLEQHTF